MITRSHNLNVICGIYIVTTLTPTLTKCWFVGLKEDAISRYDAGTGRNLLNKVCRSVFVKPKNKTVRASKTQNERMEAMAAYTSESN